MALYVDYQRYVTNIVILTHVDCGSVEYLTAYEITDFKFRLFMAEVEVGTER